MAFIGVSTPVFWQVFFAGERSFPIVLWVLVIGLCGQFAVSGLESSIVCLVRRQPFREFGLNTKNLIPTLLMSILCCMPELTYCLVRGYVSGRCPFQGLNTNAEVLASAFPSNILGFLITALLGSFFEGFNLWSSGTKSVCSLQADTGFSTGALWYVL